MWPVERAEVDGVWVCACVYVFVCDVCAEGGGALRVAREMNGAAQAGH